MKTSLRTTAIPMTLCLALSACGSDGGDNDTPRDSGTLTNDASASGDGDMELELDAGPADDAASVQPDASLVDDAGTHQDASDGSQPPDPVVATDDTATTARLVPVHINVAANDVGADELSVASFSDGAHGHVTLRSDGWLTYTPNAGFDGDDTFTYEVRAADGRTAQGEVSVSVLAALGTVSGGTLYSAEEFRSDPVDSHVTIFGISETGVMAGDYDGRAAIWEADGTANDVHDAAYDDAARVHSVNKSGVAAGWGNTEGRFVSFTRTGGVNELWEKELDGRTAVDVNDSGTVVGEYWGGPHGVGFYMAQDEELAYVDVPNSDSTSVRGINNQGVLSGWYNPVLAAGERKRWSCFLWEDHGQGEITIVTPPAAWGDVDKLECQHVNDHKAVAGVWRLRGTARERAMRIDPTLGPLPVRFPFPRAAGAYQRQERLYGINNAGVLVGRYSEKLGAVAGVPLIDVGVRLTPVVAAPNTKFDDTTVDYVDTP